MLPGLNLVFEGFDAVFVGLDVHRSSFWGLLEKNILNYLCCLNWDLNGSFEIINLFLIIISTSFYKIHKYHYSARTLNILLRDFIFSALPNQELRLLFIVLHFVFLF